MENYVFSALELNAHGFHKPLTCRLAVAGVHINVLAPQTLWTVVRVATSAYKESAPFAGEVFFGTLEFSSRHHSFYLRFWLSKISVPAYIFYSMIRK
jgi:NAD(P)-dependent dehydrogenase (short-subunit alcohol dehydrogenase family)